MKVVQCENIELTPVELDGAAGCRVRCLIGQEDAAPSFSMRQFEVAPGGYTPLHIHAHEHEVFVLEGTGEIVDGPARHALKAGSVVFVPPGWEHQFRNTGAGVLKFLCLIPHPLRGMAGPCSAACGCD